MMIICQLNIFLHVLNATIYWHIPWNIYCKPACCAWGQEPYYQAALREREISMKEFKMVRNHSIVPNVTKRSTC